MVCDGACLKTNKYRNMVYEKGHAKLNKHNVIIIIGHIDFRKININKYIGWCFFVVKKSLHKRAPEVNFFVDSSSYIFGKNNNVNN